MPVSGEGPVIIDRADIGVPPPGVTFCAVHGPGVGERRHPGGLRPDHEGGAPAGHGAILTQHAERYPETAAFSNGEGRDFALECTSSMVSNTPSAGTPADFSDVRFQRRRH